MKFHLDLNLDDREECETFLGVHKDKSEKESAEVLGLPATKAGMRLAFFLSMYAQSRRSAFKFRLEGKIREALILEGDCDNIYIREISPVCECW